MNKPVIGIVAGYIGDGPGLPHARLNQCYYDAVLQAGALPIILPPVTHVSAMREFLDIVDGVIFPGGRDIAPARYGVEEAHEKTKPLADILEQFLLGMFELVDGRPALPALGICLGCQLFNVGRGGTLHQHVPDVARTQAVEHHYPQPQYTGSKRAHATFIVPGSLLARIVGATEIETNSSHHQANDRIGRGLEVVAHSADGICEAVEDPSRPFFLAVQWHPEEISQRPEHAALFKALVEAASKRSSVAAE